MQVLPTERLIIDKRGAKHSLIIRNVKASDFGNYTCKATNPLGTDRGTVQLTGRPHPIVFQSPSISQWRDKYNISWTVKSLAPIEEYKLYYKIIAGPLSQYYDMQRMRQTYSGSSSSFSSSSSTSVSFGTDGDIFCFILRFYCSGSIILRSGFSFL